jgi:hypothetical protein
LDRLLLKKWPILALILPWNLLAHYHGKYKAIWSHSVGNLLKTVKKIIYCQWWMWLPAVLQYYDFSIYRDPIHIYSFCTIYWVWVPQSILDKISQKCQISPGWGKITLKSNQMPPELEMPVSKWTNTPPVFKHSGQIPHPGESGQCQIPTVAPGGLHWLVHYYNMTLCIKYLSRPEYMSFYSNAVTLIFLITITLQFFHISFKTFFYCNTSSYMDYKIRQRDIDIQ